MVLGKFSINVKVREEWETSLSWQTSDNNLEQLKNKMLDMLLEHYATHLTFETRKHPLIIGINKANPCAILTQNNHELVDGDIIALSGVNGMTEVIGVHTVTDVFSVLGFKLLGIDSTLFTDFVNDGQSRITPLSVFPL